VYLAEDPTLKRLVAIKVIDKNSISGELRAGELPNEALMAARLQHANIVAIHDVGHYHERPYLVFEFVKGRTFREIIRGDGAMSPAKALTLMRSVLEAIAHAHERDVLHLDLNPGNILLSERDVAAHPTILSGEIGFPGSWDNSYHVVTGSNVDSPAVLDGFTVTRGYANGTDDDQNGGGMFVEYGSPTVANVTFRDNSAVGYGGGMYKYEGSPTLTHVTFETNWAAQSGGGMYDYGGSSMLTHVTFDANSATDWGGGGMMVTSGAPTLANVVFTSNSAFFGGGIYGFYILTCTLTNVTFSGNSATSVGGAMYNFRSRPTLTNVIMWGDNASSGPEIYNSEGGSPTISHSLIEGCGGSGGGWDVLLGTDGGGNIDADPMFKGGDFPTCPLAIYSTSPALDAGDNTAVPAWVTTDMNGDPRIFGTDVDMGAYECQGPATGIEDDPGSQLPTVTALRSAYPNPFNPSVTVEFDLDRRRSVDVSIYDVRGKLVTRLLDEDRERGTHRVQWGGADDGGNRVASGVYLLRVRSEGWSDHRKIVLLK